MSIPERLTSLREVWSVLRPGGILIVYETPNRLAWMDWHSFLLPFFHCLPDDLALRYAHKSPRKGFGVSGSTPNEQLESLHRLGRGVSYHEFELALGWDQLTVLNDGFSPRVERLA